MGLILSKATYKSSENHEKKMESITKKQNQRGTIPAQTSNYKITLYKQNKQNLTSTTT